MQVQIGNRYLEMGGAYLTELRDSNDILKDAAALNKRMQEDGYLFIRGFHKRDRVLAAREEIINMEKAGKKARDVYDEYPAFLNVVNHPEVMSFFSELLGGEAMTYDFKWLRRISKGGSTGAHYDIVYMGRGTRNIYTLWTPFGDNPIELGTLAILQGSHKWDKFKETYGKADSDRDGIGWFSEDPVELVEKFGGQWATADFRAGDAILFGMYTMHASTVNQTDNIRISCDTRYQLSSDPVDERWVGKKPTGHQIEQPELHKTIEQARKEWGLI
jgi:ectoine hydroxylase-related dioxygenase (phytanoyl-CoA dioxygenase family)